MIRTRMNILAGKSEKREPGMRGISETKKTLMWLGNYLDCGNEIEVGGEDSINICTLQS